MKTALLSLTLLSVLSAADCGVDDGPEATTGAATTLPDCPNDGVELYFVGCAGAPTSHVCNDLRGVQHAKDCVIHDAEGTLTATCVASCP
jgi:hypothetical protein